MAYFVKKTKNKKGIYLQIYESFYDPVRKHTAHRSIKPIGYVHELEKEGIDNPIEYYRQVAKKMSKEKKALDQKQKVRKISQDTAEKNLGYFLFKAVNESLKVERDLKYFDLMNDFKFSIVDLINQLVYARAVHPCSKHKTFFDVLPKLLERRVFSRDQMYDGLDFIGQEYQKIIEVYNHAIDNTFKRDTSYSFFDATNFYFEIDREDLFRRKGPSKENRHDPIVGLGLLLDRDLLPLGMKVYPGNQSEKPQMRGVLKDLKKRNSLKGKTIIVADKGLNSADNIAKSLADGDGYIFSKSIKMMSVIEQNAAIDRHGFISVYDSYGNIKYLYKEVIDEFDYDVTDISGKKNRVSLKEKRITTYNPTLAKKQIYEINRMVEKSKKLCVSQAKRSEFGESSKYVDFVTDKGKVEAKLNHEKIKRAKVLAGYNMIVTSEVGMSAQEIYNTYHNLWRIEESFRVMKSQLDARPVYLQKQNTITAHFLICYLAVLLLRILQFKVFDNKLSSEDIINFVRDFRIVETSPYKRINLAKDSETIKYIEDITCLPLRNYYLKKSEVNEIINYKFSKNDFNK